MFGEGKEYVNNTQNRGINKPWSDAGNEKTRIIYGINIMQLEIVAVEMFFLYITRIVNVYWHTSEMKVIHLYHFPSCEVFFESLINKNKINWVSVSCIISVLVHDYKYNLYSYFWWSGHSFFGYMYILLACCIDGKGGERCGWGCSVCK